MNLCTPVSETKRSDQYPYRRSLATSWCKFCCSANRAWKPLIMPELEILLFSKEMNIPFHGTIRQIGEISSVDFRNEDCCPEN